MADFAETATWEAAVTQLATSDRLKGGPDGALNVAPGQLANRTAWLKSQVEGMVYNVKGYGALGDDTTDDTSAIQDAIDAASTAGGGVVFFPAGVFCFTRLILKSNVTLQGVNTAATSLRCTDSSAGSAVMRVNDNSYCFYVRIADLTICTALSSISDAQDANPNVIGLNLAGVAHSSFENLSVGGFGAGGIVLARAEAGAEGLGFSACTQDGNYNTFHNIRASGNGKFNADGASVWLKYKANSNKFSALYFKGAGTVNAIVAAYGDDNLFSGVSFEALARGIWFKSQASNNSLVQTRGEGLTDSVSPAFTHSIIKADAGSYGNIVLGVHQSTTVTFDDIAAGAYIRIFAGPRNMLRSPGFPTTNVAPQADDYFTETLGLLTDSAGMFLFKSPGYGSATVPPLFRMFNTAVTAAAGQVLSEVQAYNNDASTYTYNGVSGVEGRGANGLMRAKAFDTSGQTGWSFLTGKGGRPTEVLELNAHVKATGGSWDVSHVMLGLNHLWVEGAASWAPLTSYIVGDQRRNGTNLYVVASITTGISSSVLVGPTGTGSGIVDGGVTWNYVSAAETSKLRFKATAPTSGTDGILLTPNTATAAPTTGTWAKGDIVWNSSPDAGEAVGWVCTTAGGAGTFVFMGFGYVPKQETVTTTATLTAVQGDVLVDAAAGFTLTLPAANKEMRINIVDIAGNFSSRNVILDPPGAATINGLSTFTLDADRMSVTVISNGTNYFVIG